MVDKKLVATTVSSCDVGMQRRTEPVTTSSHEEITNKKEDKQQEETDRIHISFKSKDSKKLVFGLYQRQKKTLQKKKKGRAAAGIESKMTKIDEKAEAVHSEAINTWTTGAECSGSSSKASPHRVERQDNIHCLTKEHAIDEFE